jgi:transposase
MAFLVLVPSERSTGEARKQGGITKMGNTHARKFPIEAAWNYRHSAGISERHEKRSGVSRFSAGALPVAATILSASVILKPSLLFTWGEHIRIMPGERERIPRSRGG